MLVATKKAKVISFANHKGGVGKTSCACNIGAALANKGANVLLIDLDPQANLSLSFGIKDAQRNVYRCLMGEYRISEVIMNIHENLEIVPTNLELSGAEIELASESGRELLLRELLEEVRDQYDYILIDSAPSLGLLTLNSLTAADEVYIPLQTQYLAVSGVETLRGVIDKIRKRLNKNLIIGGVIITQYDQRRSLDVNITEVIKEHFGDCVFDTKIRSNVSIAEAPSAGKDIFRYAPKSNGAADFNQLVDEMLTKYALRKNG
jgi:chromosome partitioning protein